MASTTTENTFTGDGTTVLFSFTFPYIEAQDVRVSVDGEDLTIKTEYTFANATTIQTTTAPATGKAVRIYRRTDSTELKAVFFPGSAIRARDLNDNFTQNLYVTQEAQFESDSATDDAAAAKASAAAAKESADDAAADAKDAADDATAAQTSATAAQTSATAAQTAATAAETKATSAETKAASAETKADAAVATANGIDAKATSALSKATSAETKADSAVSTAEAAEDKAQEAIDSINAGPVLSVNGDSGIVVLEIGDLDDVDTTSSGHVPSDGQSLVWNQSMGHWMPADATLVISSLPTLP